MRGTGGQGPILLERKREAIGPKGTIYDSWCSKKYLCKELIVLKNVHQATAASKADLVSRLEANPMVGLLVKNATKMITKEKLTNSILALNIKEYQKSPRMDERQAQRRACVWPSNQLCHGQGVFAFFGKEKVILRADC